MPLDNPRGTERKDPRIDRFLERPVAARQLRGDRATVLRVPRHRRAIHQDRGSVVATVARAAPHGGVKDNQVVAHYGRGREASPGFIRFDRLVEGLVVAPPRPSILRTTAAG